VKTRNDIAKELGITPKAMNNYINNGRVKLPPAQGKYRTSLLYDDATVKAYLDKRPLAKENRLRLPKKLKPIVGIDLDMCIAFLISPRFTDEETTLASIARKHLKATGTSLHVHIEETPISYCNPIDPFMSRDGNFTLCGMTHDLGRVW
jgi:hypothetical protein